VRNLTAIDASVVELERTETELTFLAQTGAFNVKHTCDVCVPLTEPNAAGNSTRIFIRCLKFLTTRWPVDKIGPTVMLSFVGGGPLNIHMTHAHFVLNAKIAPVTKD
jgi:hypothetical protein